MTPPGPTAAILRAAKSELAGRESSLPRRVERNEVTREEAERSLACWRAIVAVIEGGSTEFHPCLGKCPQAWVELVKACHAAVEHRAAKNLPAATDLRHLRSLLIRSAVRAGAKLPSFDNPREATVGVDGPRQQESEAA